MSAIDELNKSEDYFSKNNFDMLFWVSLIFLFFSLFFGNDVSIYYLIGTIIFFIFSKINWQSKYLSWIEPVFGILYFLFFVLMLCFPIVYFLFLKK